MLVLNWLLFCPIQLAQDTFFILTVSGNFIDEAIWENKGVESIWCVTLQLKVSIFTKHSLGWSQYSKVTYLTPWKTNTNIVSTVTSKSDQHLCCYFHLEHESIIGNSCWAWFLFRLPIVAWELQVQFSVFSCFIRNNRLKWWHGLTVYFGWHQLSYNT